MLDLGCGDGALLRRLPSAIGVDLSPHELARARGPVVNARAQALPFADRSFEVVACHLAFMLFDAIADVVAEIDRVLVPGGSLIAVLGGGPVADPAPDDAFPRFLGLVAGAPLVGDRRARTEAGWRALFAGWTVPAWERHELVLDGSFEDVWTFLEASYQLPEDPLGVCAALAAQLPAGMVRCRAVSWIARATKPTP